MINDEIIRKESQINGINYDVLERIQTLLLTDLHKDLINILKIDGFIELRGHSEDEKNIENCLYELEKFGLVKFDYDSWHKTFVLNNKCKVDI